LDEAIFYAFGSVEVLLIDNQSLAILEIFD